MRPDPDRSCVRCVPGDSPPPEGGAGHPEVAARENRGLVWIVAAFLICPCHLPLTLALAAALLAGTAVGASLGEHPVAAGVLISLAWLAATARGFRLLRTTKR
jgi:MerE protein